MVLRVEIYIFFFLDFGVKGLSGGVPLTPDSE